MPTVTVIIPVYNSETFIAQALNSVLRQSFTDFEVVIIDDGSTDCSRRIIEAIDGPIRYYYQNNRGVAAARNTGLSLAKGEWVAFLDSDDIWHPDKLLVQLKHARDFSDVKFFYSDIDLMDEEGSIQQQRLLADKLRRRKARNARWFVHRTLRRRSLVSLVFDDQPFPYPSTVLAKKNLLLEAGGFDSRFTGNYHEDLEFFARVRRHSPLYFIPEVLVKYRLHPLSTDNMRRRRNWLLLLHRLHELWRDDLDKQSMLRDHFAFYFAKLAKDAVKSGDFAEARELYLRGRNYGRPSWSLLLTAILASRISEQVYGQYLRWRDG
jgi:glycosyltransferase involved in cell wall biosynthesis